MNIIHTMSITAPSSWILAASTELTLMSMPTTCCAQRQANLARDGRPQPEATLPSDGSEGAVHDVPGGEHLEPGVVGHSAFLSWPPGCKRYVMPPGSFL